MIKWLVVPESLQPSDCAVSALCSCWAAFACSLLSEETLVCSCRRAPDVLSVRAVISSSSRAGVAAFAAARNESREDEENVEGVGVGEQVEETFTFTSLSTAAPNRHMVPSAVHAATGASSRW